MCWAVRLSPPLAPQLELPNYWGALCERAGAPLTSRGDAGLQLLVELEALLQARLSRAVHECVQYGLDDV